MVVCAVQAQEIVKDPEADFLATPAVVWSQIGVLKGPEILRLDLDLREDGVFSTFLAYRSGASKEGLTWTAYTNLGGGTFRRQNRIVFRPDTYRSGKIEGITPTGGLIRYSYGKGGGDLVRYELDASGVLTESVFKSLDIDDAEDQKLFEAAFGRNLNTPSPQVNLEEPPFKLIHTVVPRPTEETNISPNAPKPAPSATQKQSPSTKVSPTSLTDGSDSRSSTFWIICLLAIAVGLGLLWYTVAKRS